MPLCRVRRRRRCEFFNDGFGCFRLRWFRLGRRLLAELVRDEECLRHEDIPPVPAGLLGVTAELPLLPSVRRNPGIQSRQI